MGTNWHRIGVIGTKGKGRLYVSGTEDEIELTGRVDALHWNKREATILTKAFNEEFERLGREERFQAEKAH
jgi:hypothetical protein